MRQLWFFILFTLVQALFLNQSAHNVCGAPFKPPREMIDQPWRIHSFLSESHLQNQYFMFIEFEEDGTAWIASSNGLIKYDGYLWTPFTQENGLPSNFVRCILRAKDGRFWIGTDNGAGVFDGTGFHRMGSDQIIGAQCVRRIREDPDGTLWFCLDRWPHSDDTGGLVSLKDGQWTLYTVDHGLPSNNIIDYFCDSKGRRFALTTAGIGQMKNEGWIDPLRALNTPRSNTLFWSIAESPEYGVIATTGASLFVLHNGQWKQYDPQIPRQYKLCQTRDGQVYTCSDTGDKKHFFSVWNGNDFEPVSSGFKSPSREIIQVCEAPDGSIWCIGFDCFTRWLRQGSEWTEFADCHIPRLVDNQGRIWFSFHDQIIRWDHERWERVENGHTAIAKDHNGDVWGWSAKGITLWQSSQRIDYASDVTHLAIPMRMNIDAKGSLFFYGTNTDGRQSIVIHNGNTWRMYAYPALENGSILGSTSDPKQGIWYLFSNAAEQRYSLLHIDREILRSFPADPRIAPPFPTYLRIDNQLNIWMYGHFGLYRRRNVLSEEWQKITTELGENFTSSALTQDTAWFGATALLGGQGGILRCRKDTVDLFPADLQDYGAEMDDGSIYFSGDECVYSISKESDYIPARLTIPNSGLIQGIVKDQQERVWIGMYGATLRYTNDNTPPDTKITCVYNQCSKQWNTWHSVSRCGTFSSYGRF